MNALLTAYFMRIVVTVILPLLVLGPHSLQAQDHEAQSGCAWSYYGDYEPATPLCPDDVPEHVWGQVLAHIESRLGPDFASRLSLSGGQVVDKRELFRVHPSARHYRWRVPAYNLFFRVQLPSADELCASMKLDEEGNLIQELSLPDIVRDPTKANVVARADAVAIARTQSVPVERARIELSYFPDTDTLEWLFCNLIREEGSNVFFRCLHVPAHLPSRFHWSEFMGIR